MLSFLWLNFLFWDIETLNFDELQRVHEQIFENLHATTWNVGGIKILPISAQKNLFVEHTYPGGIGVEVHDYFIVPQNFAEKTELKPTFRIIFETCWVVQ